MFARPLHHQLHPRPESSKTILRLGRLATRMLLFTIALAFLQGFIGVQEASADESS